MTSPDDRFYDRAFERIYKGILVLAAGGTLAALVWRGWRAGAGFALGSAVSWLNYRWLKQVADAVGGRARPRARLAVILGLRYLLLGGGAYVILRYSKISVPSALLGLFVSVAAVIVEILYELVYGARD